MDKEDAASVVDMKLDALWVENATEAQLRESISKLTEEMKKIDKRRKELDEELKELRVLQQLEEAEARYIETAARCDDKIAGYRREMEEILEEMQKSTREMLEMSHPNTYIVHFYV